MEFNKTFYIRVCNNTVAAVNVSNALFWFGWLQTALLKTGHYFFSIMEIKRKYHDGQIVWVCRSANDKPHPATITGVCGVSGTGNVVYEFEHRYCGCLAYSGAADFDIYETEKAAKRQYRKYKITAIFERFKRAINLFDI